MLPGRTFIPTLGGLGARRLPRCGKRRPWWPWKCGRKPNGDTTRMGCRWLRVGICRGHEDRIYRRRNRSRLVGS